MGLFEGGQMLRSPDSPSIMMDCASGSVRATRAIRCAWSSSTPYRSTGQALRADPFGTCAGLSESSACENEPGVPVFFGWELGVAGVEIPSVVEPGGLGFGKVAADGLDVGGTLGRWKRTQMIDDRREAGLRAKDTLNKSVGLCHSIMSPRRERMFGVNDAMHQPTFADLEYDGKKRKTRREIFLERMDSLIPWDQLEERIRPFYPKAGRGRRPYELSAMLRIHCVQLFYNLSDPGMEDMLYEVESVRRFVGLRLSGPLPDETTILNFRHLLEEHELGQGLFEEINRHLESQGLRLREGTIVDASIIEAPSSTKNRAGDRDPEMHQTKKGNEWHFGMKVHIGADAETGVVHSVTTTPANVHDVTEAHRLLHGREKRVWGDAGYQGVDKRAENRELGVEWQVAMRPGRRRQLGLGSCEALAEKRKASVRAKVEHPFLYVKRHFGYAKVRYRGLAKNTQRLMLLLGLTNLITADRYLVA